MQDTAFATLQPDLPPPRPELPAVVWLLKTRWLALGLLVLGGTFTWLIGAAPTESYQTGMLVAAGVGVANGIFTLLFRRAGTDRWGQVAFALVRWLQHPCDIVAVTLLLYAVGSGGISPFTVFYGVVVVGAVGILPVWGVALVAAFATLCYSSLMSYEWLIAPPNPADPLVFHLQGLISPLYIVTGAVVTMAVTLSVTALISARLAWRLREDEARNRRQVNNLTVLHHLARDLAASLEVDEVLNTCSATIQQLLAADVVSFAVLRPDGHAEHRAGSGLNQAMRDTLSRLPLPLDNPLLARLRGGVPILAPDVAAWPGLHALLLNPATRSFYCFPLVVEQETIGTLNIHFIQPTTLPAETADMLAALAHQAALALARARLYQEATRSALEMAGLYHIGLATSSSLEIGEVLMQIYQQVQHVLHPDTFFIALRDPPSGELRFELVIEQGQILPWHKVPLHDNTLTAWVARTAEPLLIRHHDAEQERLPAPVLRQGLDTQALVAVPLTAKDRVIGVISVQRAEPEAFDGDDLRLLSAIAAQAALALENARLHEEMRERAQRDSLTGAYNHAALIARLDAAITAGGPVALIMLDVDRFKEFNDRWGHQAGDVALQSLVAAIQGSIKSVDTVGRWGGEEFAVVLPGARAAEAARVAARIRDRLAGMALADPVGRALPTPTLSQGVAAFPAGSGTALALVDAADRALYRAKAQGRNQIVQGRELRILDRVPGDPVR